MIKNILVSGFALLSVLIQNMSMAELPPDLKVIGSSPTIFEVRGLNDNGQVLVTKGDGTSVIWSNGSFSGQLLPPAGALYANGLTMSKVGTSVGGEATFEKTPNSGQYYYRAVFWSGPGVGVDLGSINVQADAGASRADAISPNGSNVAGFASYCRGPGAFVNCSGPVPAAGTPFSLFGPMPAISDSGSISSINNQGIAVGHFTSNSPAFNGGVLFSGGSYINLGFNPRRILNNGNIIGGAYSSNGVRLRTPDGTVTNIPCGTDAWDANERGDILSYISGANNSQSIWHEGQCYMLADLMPTGFEGYKFPSLNPGPSINSEGQIATMAVVPGGSISNPADYRAILLTPQYPLAIEVTTTPTTEPGEFEFEAKVLRGTPNPVVVWDFGDGSSPQSAGNKVKKKYTKPGTYTAKAVVTASDGSGLKATSTKVITISAPTLQVGITLPNHENGEVGINTDFQIVVNVSVANNGVGDISNITFQGGTFTVSDGTILSFTTASTSPFSLSPGTGNSYPLNVKAVKNGSVKVATLITAKDAAGKNASATTDRTITVGEGGVSSTDKPNGLLIKKIDETTALIKKLKAKPSKTQKTEQKEIKTRLKTLAGELVAYLSAHAGEITATSAKINLSKLASAAKKSVLQAAKVKDTFSDDRKAANKSLSALKKGIAP